ncbi:hypothetical protein C8R44DRAFT_241080 [Mycena epipterygia]|nr:hypothetical protein C8R44DRAFT_241080 [Mycena epipterygia]
MIAGTGASFRRRRAGQSDKFFFVGHGVARERRLCAALRCCRQSSRSWRTATECPYRLLIDLRVSSPAPIPTPSSSPPPMDAAAAQSAAQAALDDIVRDHGLTLSPDDHRQLVAALLARSIATLFRELDNPNMCNDEVLVAFRHAWRALRGMGPPDTVDLGVTPAMLAQIRMATNFGVIGQIVEEQGVVVSDATFWSLRQLFRAARIIENLAVNCERNGMPLVEAFAAVSI